MAYQNANEGIPNLIYQPLDATSRQIRVLELYSGVGDAPIEGRLLVTSISPLIPIIDENWALEAELQLIQAQLEQAEAELPTLQALIQLENKSKSLDTEIETVAEQNKFQLSDNVSQMANLSTALAIDVKNIPDKVDSPNKPEAVRKSRSYQTIEPSRADQTIYNSKDATMIPYEAISYCWSSSQSKTSILLEGLSFEVPCSAAEALHNLRYADLARVVWIDALCIDQENLEERSQQVRMMGDVYRNSTRTLIWLGPSLDDNRTQRALQLCTAVSQQIVKGRELLELSDVSSAIAACHSVSIPDIYDPGLLDLVFANEWFTRTWVWQEAALSPISICHIGRFKVPWLDIMLIALWVIEHPAIHASGRTLPSEATLSNMRFPTTIFMKFTNDSNMVSIPNKLSQIIRDCRYSKASDPRDKIYGLLGLTRWSRSGQALPPGLQPDYSKSVCNCMLTATRVMIEEDRNLDILSDSLLSADRGQGSEYEFWPSWLPIWCKSDDLQSLTPLNNSYQAHNGRTLSVDRLTTCCNPGTLTLDGYVVDAVKRAIPVADDCFSKLASIPADFQSLQNAVAALTPLAAHVLVSLLLTSTYHGQRITEDVKIMNVLADCLMRSSDTLAYPSPNESNNGAPSAKDDSVSIGILENVMNDMRMTIRGRHLFTTKYGRIGLGPKSLREDDVVVVLFGGKWPFVLREQEDHYIIIGHSYVHGIMHGEAVRDMETSNVLVKSFDIH